MDVAKAEAGERELNAFINRQAKRKGKDAANAHQAFLDAEDARKLRELHEENRHLWIGHYRRLTDSHLKMAIEARRKARELAK
jgi:hypothetical protein